MPAGKKVIASNGFTERQDMMQRRQFLSRTSGTLALGALAATAGWPGLAMGGNNMPSKLQNVGLQLSTVTPLMMKDFEGTLARVGEIGYTEVEFSALGHLGRPTNYIQQLLQQNNLTAPVGRISPQLPPNFPTMTTQEAFALFREKGKPEYLLENVRHSLDIALEMGQQYLNLPALMPDNFGSADQVKRNIERLNEAGALCAEAGVLFGYHNHDWELKEVDGIIPYELMLEQTEPGNVAFQIDAYWIVKGGGSLEDYLTRHAGRFPSCHMKDIDASGDFEDVGYGQIDFPAFTRLAVEQGAKHFFVERDNPPDPAKAIVRSYAYLSEMTY